MNSACPRQVEPKTEKGMPILALALGFSRPFWFWCESYSSRFQDRSRCKEANNFVLFNQQLCSIHPEHPLPLAQMAIPGHIKQTATARLENQSRRNASLHARRPATSI